MVIIFLMIFGIIGLFLIFANWDILMSGVAIGNSSALAVNYSGFNSVINALPWIVPLLFVFIIGLAWWWSRKRG